jgi:hypothetical protein
LERLYFPLAAAVSAGAEVLPGYKTAYERTRGGYYNCSPVCTLGGLGLDWGVACSAKSPGVGPPRMGAAVPNFRWICPLDVGGERSLRTLNTICRHGNECWWVGCLGVRLEPVSGFAESRVTELVARFSDLHKKKRARNRQPATQPKTPNICSKNGSLRRAFLLNKWHHRVN